tara:strand:+ start:3453 stop:4118 length:666 start_codon:yes stop_codon:yes gene_type:complete
MRQHVNPLSSFFQRPLELPKANDLFENDNLPIHLDIGSARGKFLLELALLESDWNYLGIEIRNRLVIAAEKDRTRLNVGNLRFLYCNANISLESWMQSLRPGQLKRVSIQFPDPWFKRRHYKRRLLKPALLIAIAKSFTPGCQLFIQSDVLSVIQPMIDLIDSSQCFERQKTLDLECNSANPFLVMTERETYVTNNKLPIYRVLFQRNSMNTPELSFLENN